MGFKSLGTNSLRIACVALVLAGCSKESSSSNDSQASGDTPKAAAPKELVVGSKVAEKTPRAQATFEIMSIEMNPACQYPDYGKGPFQWDAPKGRNTHVALEVIADVAPAPSDPSAFVNIPSLSIKEQLPGGLVATELAQSNEASDCLKGRPQLETVSAGTKERGWILLAVANPEGALEWRPGGSSDVWVLKYPPK